MVLEKKFQKVLSRIINLLLIFNLFLAILVLILGGVSFQVQKFTFQIHTYRNLFLISVFLFMLKIFLTGPALIQIKNFMDGLEKIAESKKFLFFGFILIWFALNWVKISQYLSFNIHADFSYYHYSLSNTLMGDFLLNWEREFFAGHFSPLVLLLLPFYLMYAGPYTLLIWQATAVCLSLIFLYKLSQHFLANSVVSLLITLAYLGSLYLMRGFYSDFHIEIFAPLLILAAFYYFIKQKDFLYFLFLILFLAVKEDCGVYAIGLGLFIFFIIKNRKIGLATLILSLLWLFMAFQVLKFYNPDLENYLFVFRWEKYGNSLWEIVWGMFSHPFWVLQDFFRFSFFKLFFYFLFIPLLFPHTYLLYLLPLLVNLTSNEPQQFSFGIHYGLPVIPFIYMAFLLGLRRLSEKMFFLREKILFGIALLFFVFNFGHFRFFDINSHHKLGQKIISQIPAKVSVAAQGDLLSHIPARKKAYMLPNIPAGTWPDYIILDEKGNKWPHSETEYQEMLQGFLKNSVYTLLINQDGYFLFKKQ